MKYSVIIKPEAEIDLSEAIDWYESQREGLGIDLLLHFEDKLTTIQRNPSQFEKILKNFRRAVLHKFPYIIYYLVDEQNKHVNVYAFLNTSRNPQVFTRRINVKV